MVALLTKENLSYMYVSLTLTIIYIGVTISMESDSTERYSGSTGSVASWDVKATYTQFKSNLHFYFITLLATFVKYPTQFLISATKFSSAGLRYGNNEDEVFCDSCKFRYKGWSSNDVPLEKHRKFAPDCEIVKRLIEESNCGNDELQGDDDISFENNMKYDNKDKKQHEEEDVKYGEVDLSLNSPNKRFGTSKKRSSTRENYLRITQENIRLSNELICVKCGKDKVDCLALPCRHLAACEKCLDAADQCFVCSMHILGTAKTYLV